MYVTPKSYRFLHPPKALKAGVYIVAWYSTSTRLVEERTDDSVCGGARKRKTVSVTAAFSV